MSVYGLKAGVLQARQRSAVVPGLRRKRTAIANAEKEEGGSKKTLSNIDILLGLQPEPEPEPEPESKPVQKVKAFGLSVVTLHQGVSARQASLLA